VAPLAEERIRLLKMRRHYSFVDGWASKVHEGDLNAAAAGGGEGGLRAYAFFKAQEDTY
jgi:hypothetical protein